MDVSEIDYHVIVKFSKEFKWKAMPNITGNYIDWMVDLS